MAVYSCESPPVPCKFETVMQNRDLIIAEQREILKRLQAINLKIKDTFGNWVNEVVNEAEKWLNERTEIDLIEPIRYITETIQDFGNGSKQVKFPDVPRLYNFSYLLPFGSVRRKKLSGFRDSIRYEIEKFNLNADLLKIIDETSADKSRDQLDGSKPAIERSANNQNTMVLWLLFLAVVGFVIYKKYGK